ncbi:AAA ATPase-like protein [Archangium gephyra]|uniref:AAA ATPase-like protein n=1 Tax=Archangium gephyra TaxID=48 RepID=A0AAC8Q0C4_9BACT|nr:DUF3696 domain-containing protein [Archangium gephyra]AKI98578.1 Hypothetical protein AA314_00205 [Archangium gephyra]REG20325.1 AAA ATPase-like protein [Archangium gephyra]
MFTQLRIQNFKAWKDTGNIRLAPLTVFFGPNSSGKTSLLQLLLLLQQSEQSSDRKRTLNFGDSHSVVDLGVYPEMVFRHEPQRRLRFAFKWRVLGAQEDETERPYKVPQGTMAAFKASIGPVRDGSGPLGLDFFQYSVCVPSQKPFTIRVQRDEVAGGYELSSRGLDFQNTPEISGGLSSPVRFYGFPREVDEEAVDDLEFSLEEQLDAIHYLGPLRELPARYYSWSGEATEGVGIRGERSVEALLAGMERTLRRGDGAPVRFGALIADWLVRMQLLDSFEVKRIAPSRRDYEVLVRSRGGAETVNLIDVGFGISQILPVLVQAFYVERESTILLEQPELHLHPSAQSSLADLFIDAIQMREDALPRNIQFLVESHSEHFLRRLQRRIAEGVLTPDQTALYFCKPGPEGSTIEELKLDEFGNISNWPENFFGDEVGDLSAMAKAAMKRQLGSEVE